MCPSNGEIAGLLHMEGVHTASKSILRLEARGAITVKRYRSSRVVTIVSTGQSTASALPPSPPLHADGAAGADHQSQGDASARTKAQPLGIDREPCRLCGVRGDIGCRHTRRAARPFLFVPVAFHSPEIARG